LLRKLWLAARAQWRLMGMPGQLLLWRRRLAMMMRWLLPQVSRSMGLGGWRLPRVAGMALRRLLPPGRNRRLSGRLRVAWLCLGK
jgi:hypothetical protein